MLAEGHGPRCVHRLGFQWRRFLFASDFVSGWLFRGVFSDVWGFVGYSFQFSLVEQETAIGCCPRFVSPQKSPGGFIHQLYITDDTSMGNF